MNLIGKIFVGLIAAMSISFFSLTLFLWNSQASWKQVADEKDQLIKSINDENQKIKAVNTALSAQLNTAVGANTDSESENNEEGTYSQVVRPLVTDNDNAATANQTFWKNRTELESKLQEQIFVILTNNVLFSESRGFIDKFSDELETAQNVRAVFLKNLTETMAEKYKQDYIISDISSRNEKLVNDYDIALQVLNEKKLDLDTNLFKTKPAYPVQGLIAEIQKDNSGLMMITIGSNDGLFPNHILEVSRNGSYLGRLKVLTTEPNRSVCKVIPEYRRGIMREGDLVSSNLKK